MNETKMSDLAERPLVSVIIPCFNREDYIRETIDSVLHQNYPNMELIVIDDGCTDKSRDILESYGKQIHLLEHPGRRNRGQSAAINLGLKKSSGEFVAILDSDDLFFENKLMEQVQFLSDNPDTGAVYANGINIDSEGKRLFKMYPEGKRDPIGPEPVLEHSAFNLPSNAMVRKKVFDQAGFFNEDLRTAQDHDMAVRVAEIAPVGYIDKCLWSYRRHNKSISHNRTMERWQNGFRILESARQRYPYPLGTVMKRKAVLHFRLGQCYFQQKQYGRALAHLLSAAFLDPRRSLMVLLRREKVSSPQS